VLKWRKMEELVKGDAVMEKAMTTLEFLSQDRQTRMLYEERQKGLHDFVSAIENAKEEGKLEGKLEGMLEGKLETARVMLAEGLDLSIITKVTGLSREQIASLQN